jgi:hypothetical protein
MSDRALKDIHKVLVELLKEIKEIRRLYAADLTACGIPAATDSNECPEMASQETLDDDAKRQLQELGLDLSEFNS